MVKSELLGFCELHYPSYSKITHIDEIHNKNDRSRTYDSFVLLPFGVRLTENTLLRDVMNEIRRILCLQLL